VLPIVPSTVTETGPSCAAAWMPAPPNGPLLVVSMSVPLRVVTVTLPVPQATAWMPSPSVLWM